MLKRFWRMIFLFLAVVFVNFVNVSNVHATCILACANVDVNADFNLKLPTPSDIKGAGNEFGEGVAKAFDKKAKGIGKQFAEGASQAFEEFVNRLFDEKITLFLNDIKVLMPQIDERLDKFDNTLKTHISKADQIIQESLTKFKNDTDEIIANIRTDVIDYGKQEFEKSLDKLKNEIVDKAITDLDNLRKKFRQDIDDLLDKAAEIAFCVEGKTMHDLNALLDKMKNSIPSFSWCWLLFVCDDTHEKILASCYEDLKFDPNIPLEPTQYLKRYDLYRCQWLKTIMPDSSIKQVLNTYGELATLTQQTACSSYVLPEVKLRLKWDWFEDRYMYRFWDSLQ